MHHRPLRPLPTFFAALALFGLAGHASDARAAGEKDKEALKLHDQAMDEDYLSVEFDKAEKRLADALKKCGKSGCSAEVVGKIHIAMGTVQGAGGKLDDAKESFVAALKADPGAALNEAYTTPELATAYAEAQKAAGGDTGKKKKKKKVVEEDEDEDEDSGSGKAGGDFSHSPVAEQAVNTPVPVYIELPDDIDVAKVTLRYKPFGGSKWKSLEMKRIAGGYGAEIPCEDVTTTGDIKYYIIAKDEEGDPAGTAGSLKAPHKVPIRNDIEDAPSLPGKKPPKACMAKEDCPPGLPGCPDAKGGEPRGDKGWGASCDATRECKSGLVCLNGTCEEGADDSGSSGGSTGGGKRNLIGLGIQLDALMVAGQDNVCSGTAAAGDNYVCFNQNGTQFYGVPAAGQSNAVGGGFGIGGARILLSYDRQILQDMGLTFGVRLGYAFGGSPSSETEPPAALGSERNRHQQANPFMPFHGEVRAGYTFGGSPLEKSKIRPHVFVGGGLAQVNASVPVQVSDRVNEKGETLDKPVNREVDAYQITGLNFIGFGGGATYGLTDNFGIHAELKVMLMVPTFGIVFAPTVGPAFAF